MAWYDDLELSRDFLNKTHEFCELILEANRSTNLVSKNDSKKLFTRHVLDSLVFAKLSTLNYQPSAAHQREPNSEVSQFSTSNIQWTDIGSGAGFPVVPLCLYFPQVKFYAVENRKKRCEFLNLARQKLNLQNIEIIQSKAENSGLKNMDFVSCRAVGSLEADFERAKRILKKGGCFLTLKSKRIINEAKNDKLLRRAKIRNYRLPQEETEYALVELYA